MNGAAFANAPAVNITAGFNCGVSSAAMASRISPSASHALSRLRHVRRSEGAEISAMAVFLAVCLTVGAAFTQQKIAECAQFVIGDRSAQNAAALFLLGHEPGLRQDFHVMRQGRAGHSGTLPQFPDPKSFR